MTPGRVVAGFYELPIHIAVVHEVLGSDCATWIGDIPAQILAPRPLPRRIDYPAVPPALPGVPDEQLGSPFDWAITFAGEYTEPGSTCLRRLGVVLREPEEPLAELSRDFGLLTMRIALAAQENLDSWFDRVRTWIEVLTEQDLDYRSPSYDLTFPGDGFQRWDGCWLTKELRATRTREIKPVSLEDWRNTLRLAGDREPPLEYLVARDARAALLREDLRRAAIDIGTATEIVLNNAYRQKITAIANAGRTLSQEQRNLRTLTQVLFDTRAGLGVTRVELDDLIHARNIAVHEGRETPADELHQCLTTLTTLLQENGTRLM